MNNFRWAEVHRLSLQTKGWLLTVREPPDESSVLRVRVPLAKPRICGATCPSKAVHSVECKVKSAFLFFILHSALLILHLNGGPLSLGYRLSEKSRAGSNPVPAAIWLGSHLASCPSRRKSPPHHSIHHNIQHICCILYTSVLSSLAVKTELIEADRLQRLVANSIARSPAGVNLLLIGGFRYRLLDNSQRFSVDIDYHWGGDLEAKQRELLSLCRRVILGQVRRELGYEGSASVRTGPDADSPNARFIDLRFWKADLQVEIPLELTQIVCLDPPTIRTAGGTVHATPSDTDLIESKIIAVLNRLFLQHRDLVDVFLYADKLQPDSPVRLKQKVVKLNLSLETVTRRLKEL